MTEVDDLKRVGAALMQAAVRKVNKPEVGTMTHDPATGKFRRVDAMLIDAVKAFGDLIGVSVGEETEAEALDRRARNGSAQRIEVVPHDPEGPKSRDDTRCRHNDNYTPPSGSGTSD